MKSKIGRKSFRYEITDLETGEVKGGYYGKRDTVQVLGEFLKVFDRIFPLFEKRVYDGYFACLFDYIEVSTNRLVMPGSRGVRAMTRSDMSGLFGGVARQTVYHFLREAEEKGVIRWVEPDGCFFVNPNLVMRGKEVAKGVYDYFKEEK